MLNSQENRAGIVKSARNLLQTYLQSSNSFKVAHNMVSRIPNPKFKILTNLLKFRYSEKATKISSIFQFFWHYLVASNYKWKMGQIFVAFSEYLNFNQSERFLFVFLCPFSKQYKTK